MKIKKIFTAFIFVCAASVAIGCGDRDENGRKVIKDPIEAEDVRNQLGQDAKRIGQTTLLNPGDTPAFYKNREYKPIWNDEEMREDFLEALQNVEDEGLFPEDYHSERIEELMESKDLSDQERAEREVILTDAYFTLSNHLLNGKLDPSKMYSAYGIEKDDINRSEKLEEAIPEGKIKEVIENLRPESEHYLGLVESLKEFRKEQNNAITEVDNGKKIEPGDEDPRMPQIAERLQELEFLASNAKVEGNKYSKDIEEAVKKFQEQEGLPVDGIIGETTIKGLNIDNEKRLKQILVNLERWRWYPRDLSDHYVLVNIPAYEVSLFENGKKVKTYKAIVGKPDRETAIFSDTIEHVVFNPTWTLPPTIKEEDVLPKAKSDPGYLASEGFAVLDKEGNELDAQDVDLESDEYMLQQGPGESNPLGQVKIMYPNRFSIYLHDTPGKQKFDENTRAISSGCVRIEGVMDLAKKVLDDQSEWNDQKIQEVIATNETTHVNVKQQIAVHHLYFTAWRENGETIFTNDIYDLDDEVYRKLME